MIKAEFGIIDVIDLSQDYSKYEPKKYHCIAIDDDKYIDIWWEQLVLLKTYFHSLARPAFGLARWGITLIPPESLAGFQYIVLNDKHINKDDNLAVLARIIGQAIHNNQYMIHFGV